MAVRTPLFLNRQGHYCEGKYITNLRFLTKIDTKCPKI